MSHRRFRRVTIEDEGYALFLESRLSSIFEYIVDPIDDAGDWDESEQLALAEHIVEIASAILAHIDARPMPSSPTLLAVREDFQLALGEYQRRATHWCSDQEVGWSELTSMLAESRLRVATANLEDFAPW